MKRTHSPVISGSTPAMADHQINGGYGHQPHPEPTPQPGGAK